MKKLSIIAFLLLTIIGFAQTNTYQHSKYNHNKEIVGYFTNWDAWKAGPHDVTQGFYNQLNIDYSQYTMLNWSFLGLAEDGSLHSGDLRNQQIHLPGQVQAPGPMLWDDIYSSWDYWLFYGELEVLHYVPDNLDTSPAHPLYWVFSDYDIIGNGSGWINIVTGETGDYPLSLPKPGGAKGLKQLTEENNVKLIAALGGWSMSKHFPEVAADPIKRARLVQDCVKLMEMGFDGIDIDWEFPGPFAGMNFTGDQEDFTNFAILVEEIRAAIGTDKIITAAFNTSPTKLYGFDWARISQSMDYFNIMSYDMHGGWSDKAGHNSPLYPSPGAFAGNESWDTTFNYLISQGVNPNQILMGVGFYGRGVITKGPAALNAPTVKVSKNIQPDGQVMTAGDFDNWGAFDATPFYNFINDNKAGWTQHWDSIAKVPYLTKNDRFLSYDNEQSIELKADYINNNNIGGVIVWQVFGDLDPGSITQTYANKLPYAPTTQAPLINTINRVFAIGSTLPANQAPTIDFINPAANDTITQAALTTISLEVAIDDSDGTVDTTTFTIDGNTVDFIENNGNYTFDFTPSSFGTFSLQAVATDDYGDTTSSQISFIVEEQTVSNIAPVITIITPSQNTVITQASFEAIPLEVYITDDNDNIASTDFILNGDALTFNENNGSYTYNFTPTAYGNYILDIMATDDAGLSTSSQLSFTVEEETSGNFQILNANVWDSLFPYRYGGTLGPGNTYSITDDFYSYANFELALQRMSNIEVTFERKCASNLYKITRRDKTTGVETVIREDAGFASSTDAIIVDVVDYGAFAKAGTEETQLRELMAFLANISQETTGGWPTAPGGQYAWGLHFNEEQGYAGTSNIGYVEAGNSQYPAVSGKSYHGRGPIQLSWNYNYGQVSEFLFGDKNVLLNNPEMVVSDGALAFQTAIWFWMTPQYPKPSAHDVMVGNWTPTPQQASVGLIPGFGATINIINGGIECNGGTENNKVLGRIGHYDAFTDIVNIGMALDGSDNVVELGCANMPQFQIDFNECNQTAGIAFATPLDGVTISLNLGEEVPVNLTVNDPNGTLSDVQIAIDGTTYTGSTAIWTPTAFGSFNIIATALDDGNPLSTNITVTIINAITATGCEGIVAYNASTVYDVAGTQVLYNNKIFSNKWWTQNEQPDSSDVWEFVQDCDGVTPNNLLPIISNVTPIADAIITQDLSNEVIISFSAIDSDGLITDVVATVNGIELNLLENAGIYSANFVPTFYGTQNLLITVADDLAGSTVINQSFILEQTVITNNPPFIGNISPVSGEEIVQSDFTSINISATVSDPDNDVDQVSFIINGTSVIPTANGDNYSYVYTPTAYGMVDVTYTAIDLTGLTDTYSSSFTIQESLSGNCGYDPWVAQVYAIPGTKVYYNGYIYENQWYAEEFEVPGTDQVWSQYEVCGTGPNLSNTCGFEEWDTNKIYDVAGITVYYNGSLYISKWWTQGNQPDNSIAWDYVEDCELTDSQTQQRSNNLLISPNPVINFLTIQSDVEVLQIMVFDMSNNHLLTITGDTGDVTSLRSGKMYIAHIQLENGNLQSLKFIKN